MTLLYDPDNTGAEAAIQTAMWNGEKLKIHIRPEGDKTGSTEYTLEVFVTTWNVSAATEDAIQVAVSFTGAGPITKGVVS